MSMIRLLVTDVDGTLVCSDRTLAPSTISAADALRHAGIRLALVSARAPAGLDVLIEPLAIDTPRAGFNGGVILSPGDRVIEELVLDADAAAAAIAGLEAQDLDVWVFAQNRWFLKNPDAAYIASEQRSIAMSWEQVDSFVPFLDGIHKIMGSSTDHDRVAHAETVLRERLSGRASVLRSQLYYIDITHPRADKGRAVRLIAAHLDIPLAAVAAIGDMPNDVSMFDVAALSFAMGNAPPEVQARAGRVVADHDDGGWAEAVGIILEEQLRTAPEG
jgi:Cof subfamily protein (haloacid dehalogenase superfamily)